MQPYLPASCMVLIDPTAAFAPPHWPPETSQVPSSAGGRLGHLSNTDAHRCTQTGKMRLIPSVLLRMDGLTPLGSKSTRALTRGASRGERLKKHLGPFQQALSNKSKQENPRDSTPLISLPGESNRNPNPLDNLSFWLLFHLIHRLVT